MPYTLQARYRSLALSGRRNLPHPIPTVGEIDRASFRSFHGFSSGVIGKLNARTAIHRFFPDTQYVSFAPRGKVDEPPVVRPAWHHVVPTVFEEQPGRAAFGADGVDHRAPVLARIKDDLPPVRRPARRTDRPAAE